MQLLDAFQLHRGGRVAIVGGGGKTTLMYRLAAEAAERGLTSVVGGTTRFTAPHFGVMPEPVIISAGADPVVAIRAALVRSPVVTCTAGHGDRGRWLPLEVDQVEAVAAMPEVDLLVLEADGSRNRPFKAPGDGEPVIPPSTTLVLAVAGLDVLGRPLSDEWVHRPERVSALSGLVPGAEVTPDCVAGVLLHAKGGRKAMPRGARWLPVLNKAEGDLVEAGERVARQLVEGGADRVVLTAAARDEPVVALLAAAILTAQ
jgi:molybdenum cofactor cytidylyltransferase